MEPGTPRVLLLGFGNPGRQDDGLGPALAAAIEALRIPGVTVDADYQLMVDDAARFVDADLVILVDAAMEGPGPYFVERVTPRSGSSFSSHGVEPPELVALARDLFQATPPVYLVGIRGYLFESFEERLSPSAVGNLDAAVRFLAGSLAADPAVALEACMRPLSSPGGIGTEET